MLLNKDEFEWHKYNIVVQFIMYMFTKHNVVSMDESSGYFFFRVEQVSSSSSHVFTIPECTNLRFFSRFFFLQGRSFLLRLKNADITVYHNRKRNFAMGPLKNET